MDAVVVRELKRISDSLAIIEDRLARIEEEDQSEIRSNFPTMPFPGFDQEAPSLPI